MAATAAIIAPRWMFTYLLFCRMGFWYHGVVIDFMDRDLCDAKFVDELITGKLKTISDKPYKCYKTYNPCEYTDWLERWVDGVFLP